MPAEAPLIFVSYASPDRERVLPYVKYLKLKEYDVWLDVQRIKAGQNWDFQIKQALNKADLIVLFLSNQAIDRRGYLQREIKLVLDKHQEKLLSDIYLIPVLLDDIRPIPEQIASIQHVQAWNNQQFEAIEDAIQHQFRTIPSISSS
ncbi:MAG: toll/interleukin-1 receptor domain-containing protein [Ferrovibrio sp.]|uniref:toll/interleukin-1 receptor domain-containing protein n=1 Tax=Ferrovibrio sp. TaxID=1917215 RepID=UPI00261CB0DF|nr:toll/interleukin-1 receptor domain-containing protein [Ferrovibrio sp.]MCW0233458.1 toll/interleukin-1 receptor domain-containing protein [Ferrovibrio sp.]